MKPKTMILMVVAVVCGLGASYMTSRLLAERDETPAEAAPVEKVTLLVAKKNLEMHTPLRAKPEDFFVEKQFAKEDAPKDALTPTELPKLKNKFIKRGLRKGDHILPEDIIDGKGQLQIPKGMRAIGMQVNQAMTAGGFTNLPGSHIDIIWTSRKGGANETFSKVLLEDVIVVAADTNDKAGTEGAIVASVVTVALNPDDSMRLTLAMETGTVKLALRNLEDGSTTMNDIISIQDLVKPRTPKNSDVAIAPPIPEPTPEPVVPKKDDITPPEPPPQPKLTKMTVTIKNGTEFQILHYWVDEDDHIVTQRDTDPQDLDPVPPTSGRGKKEEKKGDPDR